jgi:hypothetical protein
VPWKLTTPYRWPPAVALSEAQSIPFVGCGVGLPVGGLVGALVGDFVGFLVGGLVGRAEGGADGSAEGDAEGPDDGRAEGEAEGPDDGDRDGPSEGAGVATGFLIGTGEARALVGVGAFRIIRHAIFILILALGLPHRPLPPDLRLRSLEARVPRAAPPGSGRSGAAPAPPPGLSLRDARMAATTLLDGGEATRARRKGATMRIILCTRW